MSTDTGYNNISRINTGKEHIKVVALLYRQSSTRGSVLLDDAVGSTTGVNDKSGIGAKTRVQIKTSDNENVFAYKSTSEIIRGLFVFQLCTFNVLVRNSLPLMVYGRKILGNKLFEKCMRLTFYGQFVAGKTEQELKTCVDALLTNGIRPMVMSPMEEDSVDVINNTRYDENLETILRCINLSQTLYEPLPVAQIKLTALVPGQIVGLLSEKVPDPHMSHKLIDSMCKYFKGQDVQFDILDGEDERNFNLALARLKQIGELIRRKNVRILIDAEYTYLNPGLRLISLAMMLHYNNLHNGGSALVGYTYQNYLKQTYREIVEDVTFLEARGAGFGAKLVRGAYMQSERSRAKKLGYDDPVHATFDDTTYMYYKSMEFLMKKVNTSPDKYYFMVASHNEGTVAHAQNQMSSLTMPSDNQSVVFGQVYGMSDHVSATLAKNGYSVYKSIPYGPVDATLPYLQRRAVENMAVLGNTYRERQLLWKTLLKRMHIK